MICLKYRASNVSEPLMISDSPSGPWEKVGADLLQFKDKKYLVIVDYYSKYIELACLNTTTSAKHVTAQIGSVLARHGSPLILMTGNGPPFDSKEFASFCVEWDIEHVTSSPHYPQSNGQAEAAVKIVKRMLEKSFEEKKDPYLALLHYNSNQKEYVKSPAELLISRKLRSNLPISKEMLKPKLVDFEKEEIRMYKHKENYKKYHDKHAKELAKLSVNDLIMYKKTPSSKWEPGIVKKVLENCPRSYIIKSKDGVEYRRNRRHIIKCTYNEQEHVRPSNDEHIRNKLHNNIDKSMTTFVPMSHIMAKLCRVESQSDELSEESESSENKIIIIEPIIRLQEETEALSSDSESSIASYHSLSERSESSCVISQHPDHILDVASSCSSNYLIICGTDSNISGDDSLEKTVIDQDCYDYSNTPYVTRAGRVINKPKKYDD